eukprot:2811334-Rhodomonas_salina.1
MSGHAAVNKAHAAYVLSCVGQFSEPPPGAGVAGGGRVAPGARVGPGVGSGGWAPAHAGRVAGAAQPVVGVSWTRAVSLVTVAVGLSSPALGSTTLVTDITHVPVTAVLVVKTCSPEGPVGSPAVVGSCPYSA